LSISKSYRHIHRPVKAFHQFLVVADDEFNRQHALLIHRRLLLQILNALPEAYRHNQ
jgi:hypothetical protein